MHKEEVFEKVKARAIDEVTKLKNEVQALLTNVESSTTFPQLKYCKMHIKVLSSRMGISVDGNVVSLTENQFEVIG